MRKFILSIVLLIGGFAFSQGNSLNDVIELRKDINSVSEKFDVYLAQIDELFNDEYIFYLNKRGSDAPIKGLAIGDLNGKRKSFKVEIVNDSLNIYPIKLNIKKNKTLINNLTEERKKLSELLRPRSGLYVMDNRVVIDEWEYLATIEKSKDSNYPHIPKISIKILKFGRIFFDLWDEFTYPDVISKTMLYCFLLSVTDFY